MSAEDVAVAVQGEVARVLTVAGYAFNANRDVSDGGHPVRVFTLPFEPVPSFSFGVTVYVLAPSTLITLCGLRLKTEDPLARLRLSDLVSAAIPMVRMVQDAMQPGIVWLESVAILPQETPWATSSQDMVTAPVGAVATAAQRLLMERHEELEFASGARIPMFAIIQTPAIGGIDRRPMTPEQIAATVAKWVLEVQTHGSVNVPADAGGNPPPTPEERREIVRGILAELGPGYVSDVPATGGGGFVIRRG